ncbi:hypothetical protein CC2G_001412 [Coprinopsis cinerea AmutBmut pab1-1]|nr:hypothetical protein CC2G_001412 [Coprinopsis cinerea AmutBmut pab1-1]
MAPLNEAVKVRRTRLEGAKTVVYEGVMDPTWNIGNVPCGGKALSLKRGPMATSPMILKFIEWLPSRLFPCSDTGGLYPAPSKD